jgi:hypothetical protein
MEQMLMEPVTVEPREGRYQQNNDHSTPYRNGHAASNDKDGEPN